MLDLKMASYMHRKSVLSFIQTGHENVGKFRQIQKNYVLIFIFD